MVEIKINLFQIIILRNEINIKSYLNQDNFKITSLCLYFKLFNVIKMNLRSQWKFKMTIAEEVLN